MFVIDLLLMQPPGAQIYQEMGGWQAFTREELRLIEVKDQNTALEMAKAGIKKPFKGTEPPEGRIRERMKEKVKAERDETQVERWKEFTEGALQATEERLAGWGDPSVWQNAKNTNQKQLEYNKRTASWNDQPPGLLQ